MIFSDRNQAGGKQAEEDAAAALRGQAAEAQTAMEEENSDQVRAVLF